MIKCKSCGKENMSWVYRAFTWLGLGKSELLCLECVRMAEKAGMVTTEDF
jgi:hypothetical protein